MKKRPSTNRNAFTVVEMLVVIGILVVVSLGVATIFQSIGETVSRGRKLSELNQFAARIERVMREDFEAMTRDGFLVIVNKNANFGRDVQLYRGEQTNIDENLFSGYSSEPGRIRRSDEIMFFARGDFVSQRRAISPNMLATSNEAAIYYGHGQKRRPQIDDISFGNYFFNPQPWDNNYENGFVDTRLGVDTSGFVNPNEFARDWSLLRHVTLLVNPAGAGQQVPAEVFGRDSDDPVQRTFLQDSARQIALQPASRSMFKSLTGSLRFNPGPVNRALYDFTLGGAGQPSSPDYYPLNHRMSGMVDIVTQDLSTMRTEFQALSAVREPSFYLDYDMVFGRPANPGMQTGFTTRDVFEDEFYLNPTTSPRPSDASMLDLGRITSSGNWNSGDANDVRRARQWMIDALPSAWRVSSGISAPNNFDAANSDFLGGVRYEDIPTRLLFDESEFPDTDDGDLRRAYAEANQEMLGASVFVPRCTEFVVEWSYGFVNNNASAGTPNFKELTWYGLDRYVDSNNDGRIDQSDARAAVPYTKRNSSQAGTDPSTTSARLQGPDAELIVGKNRSGGFGVPAPLSPDTVEIACFGFATQPGATGDVTGMYWPWPKLIRITMTLGDPSDRDVEETYQVIFELPRPE